LKKSNTILTILLFVFFTAGVFFTVGSGNEAWGQGCSLEIVKLIQGNNEFVEFTIDDGFSTNVIFLSDGDSFFTGFGPTADFTVTEIVPPGWRLEDVVCFNDGVGITEIENGFVARCIEPNGGSVECVFVNVDPDAIPTLSEWGMISAAAGLGLVGMFFVIRRKRLQASNGSEQA
jgi:hypothetical protein